MTVGPGRSSANCRGGVGVKSNLILNLRFETVFCFFKLITEDWFLDVMWDFDFLYWDFEYDNMDLSFGGINSGSPSREQGGCWGCSRTPCRDVDETVFGVSTWNNGDVSGECSYLVSSGGAHFCSVLHLSFSTSSGRRNIRVPFLFYISSTSFEPIPVQPKTRGIGNNTIMTLRCVLWIFGKRESYAVRTAVHIYDTCARCCRLAAIPPGDEHKANAHTHFPSL